MLYVRQISLTDRPAPASFRMDTICISVNFDWSMGTSWLRCLLCQKDLLSDLLSLQGAYGYDLLPNTFKKTQATKLLCPNVFYECRIIGPRELFYIPVDIPKENACRLDQIRLAECPF